MFPEYLLFDKPKLEQRLSIRVFFDVEALRKLYIIHNSKIYINRPAGYFSPTGL